jgi:hypothetical protein
MLIVQAVRFGGQEVLAVRQAPDPVAGPGQAVVRVGIIARGGRFSAHGMSAGGFARLDPA